MKEITITSEEYKDLMTAKIIFDMIRNHEERIIRSRVDNDNVYDYYNIDAEYIDSIFGFTETYQRLKKQRDAEREYSEE